MWSHCCHVCRCKKSVFDYRTDGQWQVLDVGLAQNQLVYIYSSIVCKWRLGLFKHVARLADDVQANQFLRTYCESQDGVWRSPDWRHARGRPPITWIHQICRWPMLWHSSSSSSSSSKCVVGGGPLRSLLLPLSRPPEQLNLLLSEHHVTRYVLWSSWLSLPTRMWYEAGMCFNRRIKTSCAGVPSGRRLKCPNRATFLSLMTACMSGRPVFSVTVELVTKSDHWMARMRRWHCM